MSWLKKRLNTNSLDTTSDEVIDPFGSSSERTPEFIAHRNANRELAEMKAIQKEREKEEQAQADQLVVVHGAKVKMGAHLGEFKVLNNVPTTQGKLTGTVVEKTISNFTFYDGFQLISILGDWQHYGSYKVQDNEVLIKKSTLQVIGKMPGNTPPETGNIEIIDPGQINHLETIETRGVPVPEDEELDFDIKLEPIEENFVPLGITDYTGHKENDTIKFNIIISGKGVNEWHLKIEYKGALIYQLFSATAELEEVSIIGKANHSDHVSSPAENAEQERFWPAGHYLIRWDGFDINGIYDSTIFIDNEGFTASIIGKSHQKTKEYAIENPIKFKYKEVDWIDVRIDKNNKRIDATLRVNLKDGGAIGLECSTATTFDTPWPHKTYPWDKIPKSDLIEKRKSPIKSRTRSFKDLEKLAIDGLNYHWGRNRNHAVAKDVKINGESYEVYMNAVNTKEHAMDDVSLIYNTNNEWLRSGNPGAVTSHPMTWAGNMVSREAICYNVGYIKNDNDWEYRKESDEDIDFKFTSAHEIGHEILKFYGGTVYSYGHKGSVYAATQSIKDNAPSYPTEGEIDIMPYYPFRIPYSWFDRYIAAEKGCIKCNLVNKNKNKIMMKLTKYSLLFWGLVACHRKPPAYIHGYICNEEKNHWRILELKTPIIATTIL